MERFVNNVKKHIKEDIVIVSFGTMDYSDYILNWVVSLNKLNIDNYVIVALDNKIYRFLKRKNIHVVNINELKINKKSSIWLKRMIVFDLLLKNNISFIHSDVDAIWIKSPLEFIKSRTEDIVISRGLDFPLDFYEKYGFVCCMGFFYIKSNENTLEFINNVCSKIKASMKDKSITDRYRKRGDDQIEFNMELFDNNLEILSDDMDGISCKTTLVSLFIPNKHLISRKSEHKNEDTMVHHPLIEKFFNGKNKNLTIKEMLVKDGVYFL